MRNVTLCFCVTARSILLAMKKRGFGVGRWNGFGGGIQTGESIAQAAVREVFEESELIVREGDLISSGLVRFHFAGEHRITSNIFISRYWEGLPHETEEMKPAWFGQRDIPWENMWTADSEWLPGILQGEKIEGDIYYDAAGLVVERISLIRTK